MFARVVVTLSLLLLLVSCAEEEALPGLSFPARPAKFQSDTDTTSYGSELGKIEVRILKDDPPPRGAVNWARCQRAASAILDRAQLMGHYESYKRAEELVERAFANAPEGSGPHLLRARLNHALHRLDAIEPDLAKAEAAVLVSNATRATIAALRGDVHFYRGELEEARADYEAALELAATPAHAFRLAQLALVTAKDAEAQARLDLAEQLLGKAPALRMRAWFKLQRGIFALERGRLDEALGHYRAGEELMSGWWLLEEHIAEILTMTGKTDEARTMYEEIVDATGHPEFMDALAEIELASGKRDAAIRWIERAREVYERRVALLPTAAGGHAIDHYLAFADVDPDGVTAEYLERAQELATAELALRPGAEALHRSAEVRLALGETEEARAFVERALATGWQSADLHATASAVHRALGNAARAERALERARALNPHIE